MKSANTKIGATIHEKVTKVLLQSVHSSVYISVIGEIVNEVGEVDGWPMIWVSSIENVKFRVGNVTNAVRRDLGEKDGRFSNARSLSGVRLVWNRFDGNPTMYAQENVKEVEEKEE